MALSRRINNNVTCQSSSTEYSKGSSGDAPQLPKKSDWRSASGASSQPPGTLLLALVLVEIGSKEVLDAVSAI